MTAMKGCRYCMTDYNSIWVNLNRETECSDEAGRLEVAHPVNKFRKAVNMKISIEDRKWNNIAELI